MTTKTLSDCARCPVLRICTAHITDGTWDHRKGADPCRVNPLIDAETANAALRLRQLAGQIEPGFNPEKWLEERGL